MTIASVMPNAITGAVGVIGIVGSVVSANLARKSAVQNLRTSIAAENERARLAEKRRFYADCLTKLAEGFYASALLETSEHKGSKEYGPVQREAEHTRLVAMNSLNEVQLISPGDVALKATRVVGSLQRIHDEGGGGFAIAQVELAAAMRADLGEPRFTKQSQPKPEVPSSGSAE